MGTGGSFPGVKRQGREADHSPPTSAEVKKMWIYTSTPPFVFMAECLISYAQGQLYLFSFTYEQIITSGVEYTLFSVCAELYCEARWRVLLLLNC
jgi:hypothetical protein